MKDLSPKLSSSEAKLKYDLESWLNFARRITKNPFVKKYIISRDGNHCSWCKKKFIRGSNVHHTSYDHSCSYFKTIRISRPTLKHPNHTCKVPDCESCCKEQNENFRECLSRLVLVHPVCNRLIYQKDNTGKFI